MVNYIKRPNAIVGIENNARRSEISKALSRQGWEVFGAISGLELINHIAGALLNNPRALRPSLLVVETRLRGCSGETLAQGLQQLGWSTAVVVITSWDEFDLDHMLSKTEAALASATAKPVEVEPQREQPLGLAPHIAWPMPATTSRPRRRSR